MRCSAIGSPPRPARLNVEVWARVLMPNHVHPVLVPSDESGLAGAMSRLHRPLCGVCQRVIPALPKHLVRERFASVVMDEALLLAVLRYAALNPVRAGLVTRPEGWPWSSVAARVPNSPIFWAGPRTTLILARCGGPRGMAGRWDRPNSPRPSKPACAAQTCRANLAGNRNGQSGK